MTTPKLGEGTCQCGAKRGRPARQHAMNSDETSADTVIEAVALAMGKHRRGSQEAWDEDRRLARALHDAGLLADPADRGELYDQLDNQRNLWAKQCHEAEPWRR